MSVLKRIGSKIRKIKRLLSYESYEGTRKVKEITNDPLMDRPILLYEKISEILRIRPYFLGILLIFSGDFVHFLMWKCNPDLFWQTFTLNGLIISSMIWLFAYLIFFYYIPYMKEKYFETVEDLRPIITRNLYEELKSDFVRKSVFYLGFLLIYISILAQLSYELILGFEVGFWTENMPAWSGFRFGPANIIVGNLGGFIYLACGADAFSGSISWLVLPSLLDKDIKEAAYRDPGILGKVRSFEKFGKNLLKMTLIIVFIIGLALLWIILQPIPVAPYLYIWTTILMFLAVPLIFTSQLRKRAIKKLIKILEQQYKDSEERKLECEAAENADGLYETYRAKNDHIKSQEWLKKAAEKYEECGAYQEAAQRYSKLGNYKRGAASYKKASDKEENEDYKKYYKACAYTESAEAFTEEYSRDKAVECLRLAATYFKNISETTSNPHLKNSALYRSREAQGRLLIFDALKIYEKEIDTEKILNKVFKILTDAQKKFDKTSEVCPGIGVDAETQLKVHSLMCEFYKSFFSFKHPVPDEIEVRTGAKVGPSKSIWFGREKTKKFKIDKFKKLDESIKIIRQISKQLSDIHRFKAAKKAEIAELTLLGVKFSKQRKDGEAWKKVKAAEEISKNEFGKVVKSEPELNEKIAELTNSILYTDFPFSAPMCAAVDPEAYKNCVEFENETEVPREVSWNKDVCFRFRLCYKPCTLHLENLIKVKLRLTHFGREDLRELNLAVAEAGIHEQFLVTAKNLREGENYIRADLFHIQKDCERKIATKEFVVQRI